MLRKYVVLALVLLGCSELAEEPQAQPARLDAPLIEVISVGLLEGPEEFLFGAISDVQAAADGSFFVLDLQANAVRRFSLEGEYLGGLTMQGQGPGEIGSARAMALTDDGQLGLLDGGNDRLSFYRITAAAPIFESFFAVNVPPPRSMNGISARQEASGSFSSWTASTRFRRSPATGQGCVRFSRPVACQRKSSVPRCLLRNRLSIPKCSCACRNGRRSSLSRYGGTRFGRTRPTAPSSGNEKSQAYLPKDTR